MYLVLIAYFIRTIRTIFYHTAWWYIKEYRFDRMYVHLTETTQGKSWIFGWFSSIKWILIGIFFLAPFDEKSQIFSFVIPLLYGFEAFVNLYELRRGWKVPPLRPRALAIALFALICVGGIAWTYQNPIGLLVADKAIGPAIALFVFLSNRVYDGIKRVKIASARKKLQRYRDLNVIGVTGSYGKTTTKDLIAQLLSKKYKVESTILSQNSDIGIAERILSIDLEEVEYFICEMAAYHPGEIAASCRIFGDKIRGAVITGINEQHQSLFGSMDTTRSSKYELVSAVSNSGFVVFNGHSEKSAPMIARAKKSSRHVVVVNSSLLSRFKVDLPAVHFRENTALAVQVARLAGMNKREIQTALSSLSFPKKTLEKSQKGAITLIDSTFNSNPDAVYAALDHLSGYRGTKMLVLQPLIELGSYADRVHEKLGKKSAVCCDYVLLTNTNFNKAFTRGIRQSQKSGSRVRLVKNIPHLDTGAILFQGKEAASYLRAII